MKNEIDRIYSSKFYAFASVIFFTLVMVGCATARVYPVCIYHVESGQTAQQTWSKAKPVLESVLLEFVRNPADRVVTSTAAIVNASYITHANIERIWANFACIGSTDDAAVDDINLRDCQTQVARFVNQPWSSWPGPTPEGAPVCYQVNSD